MAVDLTPYAATLEREVERRLEAVRRTIAAGANTHDSTKQFRTEVANQVGLCGEFAAAALLTGEVMGKGRRGDLRTPDGHVFEVKTASNRWPYTDLLPAASINARFFPPKSDLILCVAPPPPLCFETVWVVGWLPLPLVKTTARDRGGYYVVPWDPAVFRRIEEWM